jgi:hypothetical protein
MLLICGVSLAFIVMSFILFAVWYGRMKGRVIFAVGMMGIVMSIVITNLPDIAGLVFQ